MIEELRLWISLAALVISAVALGWTVFMFLAQRSKATKEQIHALREAHDKRLDNHAERLTRTEERIVHLPTNTALSELTARVGDLHGDLKALTAKLEGWEKVAEMMGRQIELMDQFLRKQSK